MEEPVGKQRKTWNPDLKQTIVLAILSGELTVAEASRKYGARDTLIQKWKQNALEAMRARLQGESKASTGQNALEAENDQLKRLLAEKELELSLARKVRRL
jgi:transposase